MELKNKIKHSKETSELHLIIFKNNLKQFPTKRNQFNEL